MEKQVRAFFYDYKYYLFPEDCETLEDVKGHTHVRVKRLQEMLCMAPNFVYESIVDEALSIEEPSHIFEVYVNLYTREEYDEILKKQVRRVCPGCERFGGDAEDLEGHHREIALDGSCFERETREDRWDFATCVENFWWRIATQSLDDLAECIDKGDQKKLNKILNRELKKFLAELKFYGCVLDGKYCISFESNPYLSSVAQLILGFFAATAMEDGAPMSEAGWLVMPYRTADGLTYNGKLKADMPLVSFFEMGHKIGVRIYDKSAEELTDRQKTNRMRDVDTFLCSEIGRAHV